MSRKPKMDVTWVDGCVHWYKEKDGVGWVRSGDAHMPFRARHIENPDVQPRRGSPVKISLMRSLEGELKLHAVRLM